MNEVGYPCKYVKSRSAASDNASQKLLVMFWRTFQRVSVLIHKEFRKPSTVRVRLSLRTNK